MEVWKSTFFNENYEVSNLGNVRRKGKVDCLKINYHSTGGYGRVSVGKIIAVHKIVAYTFLGERPNGLDINHIDGDKTNNSVANLQYVTRSENCRQACNEQGIVNLKRENHNRAKLNPEKVLKIKNMILDGIKNKDIAKMFNVDASLISHIKRGAKWD